MQWSCYAHFFYNAVSLELLSLIYFTNISYCGAVMLIILQTITQWSHYAQFLQIYHTVEPLCSVFKTNLPYCVCGAVVIHLFYKYVIQWIRYAQFFGKFITQWSRSAQFLKQIDDLFL